MAIANRFNQFPISLGSIEFKDKTYEIESAIEYVSGMRVYKLFDSSNGDPIEMTFTPPDSDSVN